LRREFAGFLGFLLVAPAMLTAQESMSEPVTIDSVHVRAENVFSTETARNHWIYRTANSLRFQTRTGVVERELLFEVGDSLDLAVLEETERNLRALDLFRSVEVDTVVEQGQVIARVHTKDAWSTLPILSGSFASDGTLTGRVGLTEKNVLGTGNFLSVAYRKGTDRNGGEMSGVLRRLAGSQVDVASDLYLLSDGNSYGWSIADPWRSLSDRFELRFSGASADRRRLQYRTASATQRDTVRYRYHLYRQDVTIGLASIATPSRVLRFEAAAGVRNERLLFQPGEDPPSDVPDSVYADFGIFVTYEQPRFRVVGYVDGLNQQDVDLTTGLTVGARVASQAFGYDRTGIGPVFAVRGGTSAGPFLIRAALLANGLFNAGGLDSGRVVGSLTAGVISGTRHSTLLNVNGGILESPAPGREFDLGFSTPPRSFEPHAFVGTRALWGTLEHRWYVLPRILDQFGAALAGYVDFGGAWYEDQDARWGAEVGIGLRTSSRLSASAESSRVDVGYRLGEGFDGGRLVLTVGTGFSFF
jgi:hypothetical protein